MWYMELWERKNKFGGTVGNQEVYVLDYKDNNTIKKGKVGYFCATVGIFHVYDNENKKCIYADWGDMEPQTEEGYKHLEKRAKLLKENKKEHNGL